MKFYNAVLKGQVRSKNHIFVLESSRVLRDMAMDDAILSGYSLESRPLTCDVTDFHTSHIFKFSVPNHTGLIARVRENNF